MNALKDVFTSTGSKFFAHQEAMINLRNGKGQAITTHLMPTDLCQDTCAFCSVATRDGKVLRFDDMISYVEIVQRFGLKSVIISGGGNPLLYKCPVTKQGISELILALVRRGLEIGLITNGMPLKDYGGRRSYVTLSLEALDSLAWIRVSMAGLDHPRESVEVPDIDTTKTTLGFSYVLHDIYDEPADLNHGKVSTLHDLHSRENIQGRAIYAVDRIPKLTEQIREVVVKHRPAYVRLLPNCLEPHLIAARCELLANMAQLIDPEVAFVQYKPPSAPNACYLGYIHPVLNSDGYVYPCDSVVLAVADLGYKAGVPDHRFANPWRVCHWSEIAGLYEAPVRSLIKDPKTQCPGCVFPKSNLLLEEVVEGRVEPVAPSEQPLHVNFV